MNSLKISIMSLLISFVNFMGTLLVKKEIVFLLCCLSYVHAVVKPQDDGLEERRTHGPPVSRVTRGIYANPVKNVGQA